MAKPLNPKSQNLLSIHRALAQSELLCAWIFEVDFLSERRF